MLRNIRRAMEAIVSTCNLHVIFFYRKLHGDISYSLRRELVDLST